MLIRTSLALALMATIGCDRTNAPLPVTEANTSPVAGQSVSGEKVDRAEYVNWNQFPIGTAVTRVRTTRNTGGTVVVTTHERLLEKNAERVLVEMQIDVERSDMPLVKNEPMTHEFPATFTLPTGMQAEQFALPSLKAQKVGSETVTVEGAKYEADIYQWHDNSESGKVQSLLWSSNSFPGRVLKQTQESEQAGFSSQEVVTEVTVPTNPNAK